MVTDIALSGRNISKKFKLFGSRKKRLAEALHPFRKRYHEEFWALRDISFDFFRGEIIGILGRNGAGKSTLLQIICSVMTPTGGEIQVNGRVSALLELGSGFNPEFTARNNVLLYGALTGISREEMLRRLPAIEAFSDIGDFFNHPMKIYSSGMYVRVAFAAAAHIDPDILIIDEALSVGDIKFQEKCFRKMREFQGSGTTMVLVTHATTLVEELCDRAIVIDNGQIAYLGDPQTAVSEYEGILFPRRDKVGTIDLQSQNKANLVADKSKNTPEAIGSIGGSNIDITSKGPLLEKFLSEFLLSDNCQFRRSYNKTELRFGDGGGEIMDYLIVADIEEDPVSIQSGAEVSVYIKVLGKSGVSRPSIGLGLFTSTGLMVCSGNARLLKKTLQKIEKGMTYIYRMKFRLDVSGGYYFIHLGLTEQDTSGTIVRHDARRSMAVIHVPATIHLEGIANLSMELEEMTTSLLG